VLPPDNLPGDQEDGDDLYLTSESEESELEDDAQDEDAGVEPEPTHQAADENDADEVADPEDLGPNDFPLLNHAQQAEVEQSQEPGLRLEIKKFGGRAGQPIRVGQPIAAKRNGTEHSGNVGGDNPYAPFCSQTDWEVAKWGKLRGPSSTAFTELLEIPGVSSGVIWIMIII
jgi:hypothetical protein